MPTLLYVTREPFYPDAAGGAELSLHHLFRALRRRGWTVDVVCRMSRRETFLRRVCEAELSRQGTGMAAVQDVEQGYRCHRMVVSGDDGDPWVRWLRRRLEADAPDIVLGAPDPGCPMLNAAAASGIRSIYVANNLAALDTGRPLPRGIRVLANSAFTAAGLAALTSEPIGMILPVFGREQCLAPTVTPTYVSFINPIPEKGVAVATEVASRLPEERFLFVKGNWSTISAAASEALVAPARRLANVTVWEYQHDMRTVYGQSGILFLPSQFLETFGRVIVEAQQNGIPVVASPVAAVPYVVGEGGIVVDRKDEPEGYVRAIRELRATPSRYAALREAALANSRRPEFDPETQVQAFIDFALG